MTLGKHLVELRRPLTFAAASVAAGAVAGWFLGPVVLDAIRTPITSLAIQQGRQSALNFDTVTSAFDLRMQKAFTVGIIISSPVWLYQLWAFLIPALTRREVKFGLSFFLSAVPLFIIGCGAGGVMLPRMVELLMSFAPAEASSFIKATDYFSFVLKLALAVGVAFVTPVFLVLLNFAGVLSAVAILRSWRLALIVIILFSAIATPAADVLSMFLLALPMAALYLLAGAVSLIHDRRLAKTARRLAPQFTA